MATLAEVNSLGKFLRNWFFNSCWDTPFSLIGTGFHYKRVLPLTIFLSWENEYKKYLFMETTIICILDILAKKEGRKKKDESPFFFFPLLLLIFFWSTYQENLHLGDIQRKECLPSKSVLLQSVGKENSLRFNKLSHWDWINKKFWGAVSWLELELVSWRKDISLSWIVIFSKGFCKGLKFSSSYLLF